MKILDIYCNKLSNNVREYKQGVRTFNSQELNDIKLYLLKYKDLLESIQFYEGEIKNYKVVSCFAENFYEELFNYMFNKHAAGIAVIVVLTEKAVLLKKNDSVCKIDLCLLAELLCDGDCIKEIEGLAGGKITEKFLKFTTKLHPCI